MSTILLSTFAVACGVRVALRTGCERYPGVVLSFLVFACSWIVFWGFNFCSCLRLWSVVVSVQHLHVFSSARHVVGLSAVGHTIANDDTPSTI